jgi:NTE family protein
VFDDHPRRRALIFAVHMWHPRGSEPGTIWEVLNRHKNIQYASRAVSHIARQKQIHRLRHVIAELVQRLPKAEREAAPVRELASYGCLTHMHVVRLLAPPLDTPDRTPRPRLGCSTSRPSGYPKPSTASVSPTRCIRRVAPAMARVRRPARR